MKDFPKFLIIGEIEGWQLAYRIRKPDEHDPHWQAMLVDGTDLEYSELRDQPLREATYKRLHDLCELDHAVMLGEKALPPSSPARRAKQYGLKSLTEVMEATGWSRESMEHLFKTHPDRFRIACLGTLADRHPHQFAQILEAAKAGR